MLLAPKEPVYPYNLGDLLREKTKRWDEAQAAYEQALALDGEYVWAVRGLALLEKARGKVAQSEALFRKAMLLAPKEPVYPTNLGNLLREKTKRWDEAQAAYEQALALDGEYVWAVRGLALLEKARGKVAQSEALFRKAMSLAPKELVIRSNLAALLAAAGRGQEGEEILQEALLRLPGDPDIQNSLAWYLRTQPDRLREAAELADRTVAQSPQNHVLHTCAHLHAQLADAQAIERTKSWLWAPGVSTSKQDEADTFRLLLDGGRGRELLAALREGPNADQWSDWSGAIEAILDGAREPSLSAPARQLYTLCAAADDTEPAALGAE